MVGRSWSGWLVGSVVWVGCLGWLVGVAVRVGWSGRLFGLDVWVGWDVWLGCVLGLGGRVG